MCRAGDGVHIKVDVGTNVGLDIDVASGYWCVDTGS